MSKTTPRTKRAHQRQPAAALPDDLLAGIAGALDKKAADPVVLDLRQSQALTDFVVICTASSTRHDQCIAISLQMALARRGTKPALVEGETRAEWILIDYFDFIFHIFTPATREFYDLERLWGDAERIEIPA